MASTSYVVLDDNDDDDDDEEEVEEEEDVDRACTKRGCLGCEGGFSVKSGFNPSLEFHFISIYHYHLGGPLQLRYNRYSPLGDHSSTTVCLQSGPHGTRLAKTAALK